jgi:multiple sugar transport system permease protein
MLVWTLFPIFSLASTSFKPYYEVYHQPPLLVPENPTPYNWDWIFFGGSTYANQGNQSMQHVVPGNLIISAQGAFLNSLVVNTLATLLALLVGIPAAYSLTRFQTGGKNLGYWILSIRFLPSITIVFSLFLFFNFLKLIDTHVALIWAYMGINLPFVIWSLAAYFEEIPSAIDDAASLDGAGRTQILFRFILPLAGPAVAATAIFAFVLGWNELLVALILTRNVAVTLPVALIAWNTATVGMLYGPLSAMALLAVLPGMILAFYLQRYIVRGLTMGALKG